MRRNISTRLNHRRTIAASIVTAVLLSLGSASIAHAEYVETPYKSGSYVKALYVTDTPGSTSSEAKLQRHRWWGWEQIASVSFYGGGHHEYTFSKYCGGSGTYTYRLLSYWTNAFRNRFGPWVSSENRFTC